MRVQRSVSEMPCIPINISSELTMEEMFKMATRNTSTWGIEGYEVPHLYVDPMR